MSRFQHSIAAAIWVVWTALLGCGLRPEQAGTFAVEFEWSDKAPTAAAWVRARVEKIDEEDRVVVGETSFQKLATGAALEFSDVPHGGPYRVVVEVFARPDMNERPLYFGESEPFELQPGKKKIVRVALGLIAAPSAEDLDGKAAVLVLSANGRGYVREREVTLSLAPRGASRVVAANDLALAKGRKEQALDGLPRDGARFLLSWDLDLGICASPPCPDGTRFVFVQFLNESGYASEVMSARVELDRASPELAAASISPLAAGLGTEVVLVVNPSEPLSEPPTLRVSPSDPGFGAFVQVAGGNYIVRYAPSSPGGERDAYSFSVRLTDRAGNQREHSLEDELLVDTKAPGLAFVADVSPAVVRDGQRYSIDFELDEVVTASPVVRVGSTAIACAVDAAQYRRVRCSHVALSAEGGGDKTIWISARDLAGNEATLPAGTVLYDMLPRCGDGVIAQELLEVCDAGRANSDAPDAGCRRDCRPRRCGDGVVDTLHGEVCDDGNTFDADGCAADCSSNQACGNNLLDAPTGETCDDGNLLSHDGCSSTCQHETLTVNNYDELLFGYTPIAYFSPRQRVLALSGRVILELGELGWRRVSEAMPVDLGSAFRPAMTYDASRNRMVIYAGGRLWEWDGERFEYRIAQDGRLPPAREGFGMAHVASRASTLVFGGKSQGTLLQDLWAWNGRSWEELSPADGVRPEPRTEAAIVYDPKRDRVVLFGGTLGNEAQLLSDTWEWDGERWLRIATGAVVPSARVDHAMIYDVARERVVLTGGKQYEKRVFWDGARIVSYDAKPAPDTWEWDGAQWVKHPQPAANAGDARHLSKPGTATPSFAYDQRRSRIVAVDGTVRDDFNRAPGQVVSAQGTGPWQPLHDAVDRPGPVLGHATTYDFASAQGLLFGGYVPADEEFAKDLSERYSRDTWVWSGAGWTLLPVQGDSPSARAFPALAHDPVRGVSVLFGGQAGIGQPCQGGCQNVTLFGDTWELRGNVWRQVTTEGSAPAASRAGRMFYDAARGCVTLFTPSAEGTMEAWQWDGVGWTKLILSGDVPSAREDFDVAYDAVLERAVMFGGKSLTQEGIEVALNDTWEWDGARFYPRTPALSPAPRSGHAMLYHATRGSVLLHGGAQPNGPVSDVWEWQGDNWRELDADPVVLEAHRAFFDPKSHAAILVGGTTVVDGKRSAQRRTYTLGFDAQVFSPLCATGQAVCPDLEAREETCQGAQDGDGDGLVGCADPDCYGRCSPLCNPVLMSCDIVISQCGDGACGSAEDSDLCAADCGLQESACGDFVCGANELPTTCPGDCLR